MSKYSQNHAQYAFSNKLKQQKGHKTSIKSNPKNRSLQKTSFRWNRLLCMFRRASPIFVSLESGELPPQLENETNYEIQNRNRKSKKWIIYLTAGSHYRYLLKYNFICKVSKRYLPSVMFFENTSLPQRLCLIVRRMNVLHTIVNNNFSVANADCIWMRTFTFSRNGTELPFIIQDRSYDFNFQEARHLPQETIVRKGDTIQVVCNYHSKGRINITLVSL